MIPHSDEALLLEVFGDRLLGYLTNLDPVELRRLLAGGEELPERSKEVAEALVPYATQLASLGGQGHWSSFHLSFLGEIPEEAPTSFGNLLRIHAGGTVPEVAASEAPNGELLDQLNLIVRDVFPLFLAPTEFGMPTGVPFLSHPAMNRCHSLLLQDPALVS